MDYDSKISGCIRRSGERSEEYVYSVTSRNGRRFGSIQTDYRTSGASEWVKEDSASCRKPIKSLTISNIMDYADFDDPFDIDSSNLLDLSKIKITTEEDGRRCRIWYEQPDRVLECSVHGANEFVVQCQAIDTILKMLVPICQMDSQNLKESDQGLTNQESDKQASTIVTRDEGKVVAVVTPVPHLLDHLSSEPSVTFDQVTNKWMPLKSITVSTTHNRDVSLASFHLPESVLTALKEGLPTLPFRSFIYSSLDFKMKFVVNANRFQCGKVLVALKYDTYQAEMSQSSVFSALHRPHVILDLSCNNEGEIEVPFKFRRGMIRNATVGDSSKGVKPARYATIDVKVLSPLRTGKDGATDMNIRPYVMMSRAEFCGVSYQVELQMDALLPVIGDIATTATGLKPLLQTVEHLISTCGIKDNLDKPCDLRSTIVVPRARQNFSSGKGPIDSIPLRMDPSATTSSIFVRRQNDDPRSVLDIAQIWGLKTSFMWKASAKAGSEIGRVRMDPTTRYYDKEYDGAPTPLEYIAGLYNFWSGTIELRLDFVSNSFHNGAIMISLNLNRVPDVLSEMRMASAYTKIFHLGEQKSVTFVVPYIYDTPWRRSCNAAYTPLIEKFISSEDVKNTAISIRPEVKSFITMSVVNELNPVETAPQEIEVLVFWRAGADMIFHSLCQSPFILQAADAKQPGLDSFPRNGYKPSADKTNEIPKVKAKAQMDQGSKEDQDPTQNFRVGKASLIVQTNDNMMNIKDILRRPTLIIFNKKVINYPTNGTSFFIPIMPPSVEMQYHSQLVPERIFSDLVAQTPQAQLMSLFRFWRGSSRYTFVVSGATDGVVYITFVPHTGTRILGQQSVNDNTNKTRPIFASGLTTEILCPSVNPTLCVEAPFDTENLWCLTFEDDSQRNYNWRDKGDTVAGHIAITAMKDVSISVWWSAGDDFEYSNFYGIPRAKSQQYDILYSDAHGRVQMDSINQVREAISGVPASAWFKTAAACVPTLAPLIMTNEALKVGRKATDVCDSITKTSQQATVVLNKAEAMVDTVHPLISELAIKIGESLAAITGKMNEAIDQARLYKECIIDIVLSIVSQSWQCIGLTFVRVLARVINYDVCGTLLAHGRDLSQLIQSYFSSEAQVQAPSSDSTIVGVICGTLGVLYNTSIDARRYGSWCNSFKQKITDVGTFAYLNQVLRFVQTTFDLVKTIVLDLFGFCDPEVKAVKFLSGNSEIIASFAREVQVLTSEANVSRYSEPSFRQRCLLATLRAMELQRALSLAPSNVVKPQLARLCSDMIKFANERMVDLSSSPVRYEPFVMGLVGEPGIGKSFITEAIADVIMEDVPMPNTALGVTYTRMSGSKHWNNYKDQPIVVYDDWMNVNDSSLMTQQILELYQLKSTCDFIPEMAGLEEKRIKANPMAVILVCNDAHPRGISNVAPNVLAVKRRRDIIVEARLKPGITREQVRDGTTPLDDFQHLLFYLHRDPTDETAGCHETGVEWVVLRQWLKDTHLRYYARKRQDMMVQLQRHRRRFMGADISELNLVDPFELMYHGTSPDDSELPSARWLPMEQLELAAIMLANAVDEHVRTPLVYHIPDQPENVFSQMDSIPSLLSLLPVGLIDSTLLLKTGVLFSDLSLKALSTYIDSFNQGVPGQCIICQENKTCLLACTSTIGTQNTHYICESCVGPWRELSNGLCPACRCNRMILPLDTNSTLLWSWLVWLSNRIRNEWHSLVTVLYDLISSRLYKLTMIIFRMVALIRSIYCGDKGESVRHAMALGVDSIAELSPVEIDVWHEVPQAQMDWPKYGETSNSGSTAPTTDPTLKINIYEDVLTAKVDEESSIFPYCYHHLLVENPTASKYVYDGFAGQWMTQTRLNGEIVNVHAVDGSCADRNCPFRNLATLKTFYGEYLDVHEIALQKYLLTCINHPGKREYFKSKIPHVFQPSWLRDTLELLPSGSWWTWLSDKYDKYKNILSLCVGGAAAIGAVMASVALYNGISQRNEPTPQAMYSAGSTRHLQAYDRVVNPKIAKIVQPQLSQFSRHIEETVFRNYATLKIWKDDVVVSQLIAVGICKRFAIMPRHYLDRIASSSEEGLRMTLEPSIFSIRNSSTYMVLPYEYDKKDFVAISDTDLALFEVPAAFGLFKDIRKFFCTQDDLTKQIANNGVLLVAPTKERYTPTVYEVEILKFVPLVTVEQPGGETLMTRDAIAYTFSRDGTCGSLLVTQNHTRPLLSMHVAGNAVGTGYGVLVTQEILNELIGNETIIRYEERDMKPITQAERSITFPESCHVEYLGVVEKGMENFVPKKSSIIPSQIHKLCGLESFSEPCILDKTDPRYIHDDTPLYAGASKHGIRSKDFKRSDLDIVEDVIKLFVFDKLTPGVVGARKLTPSEAVAGIPGVEYYEAMKLNTSSGYPWTKLAVKTRKEQWLVAKRDDQQRIIGADLAPELTKVIEEKERMRKEGIIPLTIFADTLKDERRPPAKARSYGGTRVFCASPIDYTIACRQNLLHFCAAYMKKRIGVFSAVGMNPHGDEWDGLFAHLSQVGPNNIVTLDYSNFGPAFNCGVFERIAHMIAEWCEVNIANTTYIEVYCLIYECVNSAHIVNNTVYRQYSGSPSGASPTTIFNSLVNTFYIFLAWNALVGEFDKWTLFVENIRLVVYGDDLIMAVSDKYKNIFNGITIHEYFSKYDICVSSAEKGDVVPWTSILKAQFLKRSFSSHPITHNRFLAPLKWESVNDATQWIFSCSDKRQATLENIRASMLEAYAHGPKKFYEFRKKINEALRVRRMQPVTITWNDIDALWVKGELNISIWHD